MLWAAFIFLLLLWLVGVVISLGGWIHLFLALAVITLIVQVAYHRRPAH